MSTETPPYPLPDLPRAPYSEVQALALRVIEWADFSAFGPLMDALRDVGREADAKAVARLIPLRKEIRERSFHLSRLRADLENLLFEDIYDARAVAAGIVLKGDEDDDELKMGEADEMPMGGPDPMGGFPGPPQDLAVGDVVFGWVVVGSSGEPIYTDGVQTHQRLTVTLERIHELAATASVPAPGSDPAQ